MVGRWYFFVYRVPTVGFKDCIGESNEHIFQFILIPSLGGVDLLGERTAANLLAY